MKTLRVARSTSGTASVRGSSGSRRFARASRRSRPTSLGLQEVVRLEPGEGDGLDQAAAIAAGLRLPRGLRARARRALVRQRRALALAHRAGATSSSCRAAGPTSGARSSSRRSRRPSEPFRFFVTHLNWKFDEGHVRAAQMREIVHRDRGARQGRRIPRPARRRLQRRARLRRDPVPARPDVSRRAPGASTFRTRSRSRATARPGSPTRGTNPFAAPLREPDRRIDYVFVRGRDERHRGEPLEARVCFDAARRRHVPQRPLRRHRDPSRWPESHGACRTEGTSAMRTSATGIQSLRAPRPAWRRGATRFCSSPGNNAAPAGFLRRLPRLTARGASLPCAAFQLATSVAAKNPAGSLPSQTVQA